jgi:hypothetical protein
VRKEVVFCQLPALQFQIPGWRRRGEKGGCLLLGGRLQHLEDAHRRHPHGELCRSLKMLCKGKNFMHGKIKELIKMPSAISIFLSWL